MPLTLVTGPPNSGKTGRVYNTLRVALAGRRSCLLLLPTLADVDRATREFTPSGPVGLRIAQFDRYLGSRWATFGDGRRIVTELQRDVLVRAAVRGQAGELRQRADEAGLSSLLGRLARESAGATVARRHAEGLAAEVVAVIAAYRDLLQARGLIEPRQAFSLLAETLESEHDVVVAHRFADLAQHQTAYLEAAARAGGEVLLTLAWEAESPGTAALTPTVERLESAGATHECVAGSFGSTADLEALARGLFRPLDAVLEPSQDVSFCLTGEMEDEIVYAARTAAEEVRQGVSPEDVAIVFRNPWPKAAALRRALADEGFACDLDMELPLSSTAIGRAVMQLLRFAESGSRPELLAWLRSPFSSVAGDDVAGLEQAWRRRRELRPQALVRDLAGVSPASGDTAGLALHLALSRIDADWACGFDALVARCVSAAHGFGFIGDDAAEDVRAAARMAEIVREAADVGRPLEPADVLAALASARLGPGRTERSGHVQVASVERVRSRRFAVVLLGGLTADEFPAAGTEDAMTAGVVGEAARALGVPEAGDRDARERADFFAVATRPRQRLVLITHEMSPDGEPLAPSPFWSEALALYQAPDAEETPAFVERFAHTATATEAVHRPFAHRLAACTGTEETVCDRRVFSPNELEAYLACPAKWFHERMLRPESPDAQFGPMESGQLVHAVLRDTLGRLREAGHDRVTPPNLPFAMEICCDAFERTLGRYAQAEGLEETVAVERAREMVNAFLMREAEFAPRIRPVELEYEFGFGEDDDAAIDVGGLLVRGRIDRIDDCGGGVLVTDYKSGAVAAQSAFERRGLIQLQLYVAALTACGMPVLGAIYRSLKNGKTTGFHLEGAFSSGELGSSTPMSAEEFEATVQGAVSRAREAAEGIRAGRFRPVGRQDVCRYCSLAPLCEVSA